ncbi:MAG TPA: catalase family peroxidase [Caulobacteraceae bacterium]|jgi:catalase
MGVIGAAVAGVSTAFAYTGGSLTPGRLTQARVVDQFQKTFGRHPGFRRNHAKGVCFVGSFDSNGAGESLSKAEVFEPGRTQVFGRFALAGGQAYMADGPKAVRSMAINFTLRDGELWRTGINDIPVFPVRNVRGFYEQLVASQPDPATGKPDPARMKAFLAAHPETARAMALIKAQPKPSGFADATFNSLDAFRFISARGVSTPVRWSMVPEDPFQPQTPTSAKPKDPNYLFDGLANRLKRGPARWRLVVTVGQRGDPTNDPTVPWPADRKHVEVGVLTVNQLVDETHGPCRDVTFDPLILPNGISPSDDPVLSARSAAYSQSFARRSGEPAPVPAVRIPSVQGERG